MADLGAVLPEFDANDVEPTGTFEVLPAGEYAVIITTSEMKPTKAGNGKFLEFKFQVIRGEYKNRTLFDRLNLVNPNQQAVDISRGTLSAICRAVEVMTPKDSSELHNKPLVAVVKVRERQDNGEKVNEIKGYKPLTAEWEPPEVSPDGGDQPW